MATQLTEYPPSFPQSLKTVIALYFTLAASHSPKAGDRLVTEVFTPSARVEKTKGNYEGSEAILDLHRHTWDYLDSRVFNVIRVYSFDSSFRDILMLCQVDGTAHGKSLMSDFTCRIVFEDPAAEMPKIQLLQISLDSKLITKEFEDHLANMKALVAEKDRGGKCVLT